jgi:Zn-dependent M28 family amino/carboxypeptidase
MRALMIAVTVAAMGIATAGHLAAQQSAPAPKPMVAAAVAKPAPVLASTASPRLPAGAPQITAAQMSRHIQVLSSDAYEGRGPSTPAEQMTLRYITDQFQRFGVKKHTCGCYLQQVPIQSATVDPASANLRVSGPKGGQTFAYVDEVVLWTKRVEEKVSLNASDLVFVGYGISAPEWNWDDYAGVDVRGKTVVMLVNDPGFATRDPALFNGKAMTYYGRWTYKFEEAARRGAAGAILIHDSAGASYPWAVVVNSWTGRQLDVERADQGASRVAVEGWMSSPAADLLFQLAGLDYKAMRVAAAQRGFRSVSMGGLKASANLSTTLQTTLSHNVIGVIPGTKRPDEVILYMAHWDHLGRGRPMNGDEIYNGAIDNASGIGGLLALAENFAKLKVKPERTIVFIALTAEESGLIGAEHYVSNPWFPLNKTVAAFNMDALGFIGRTRNVVVVGYGKSQLEDYLKRWATTQNRRVEPEEAPEAGFFYRSDHFAFAKKGVPVLYADGGMDSIEKGPEWGRQQFDIYTDQRYHKPADQFDASLDFSGAAEDVQLIFNIGLELANSKDWPNWYPTAEFRAARDASLRGAKP